MAGLWDSLELFAPAVDPNDPASMAKAKAWQDKYFGMTDPGIEQTRRPTSFNTGNPGGMVDPEALRVRAQGGPYDLEGTRNAIAAQLQANQAAAPVAKPATIQGPYGPMVRNTAPLGQPGLRLEYMMGEEGGGSGFFNPGSFAGGA